MWILHLITIPTEHIWVTWLVSLGYTCFFDEQTLINVYKDLAKGLPDAEDRIKLRFSVDNTGKPYISYINKMTIKKFRQWIKVLHSGACTTKKFPYVKVYRS